MDSASLSHENDLRTHTHDDDNDDDANIHGAGAKRSMMKIENTIL